MLHWAAWRASIEGNSFSHSAVSGCLEARENQKLVSRAGQPLCWRSSRYARPLFHCHWDQNRWPSRPAPPFPARLAIAAARPPSSAGPAVAATRPASVASGLRTRASRRLNMQFWTARSQATRLLKSTRAQTAVRQQPTPLLRLPVSTRRPQRAVRYAHRPRQLTPANHPPGSLVPCQLTKTRQGRPPSRCGYSRWWPSNARVRPQIAACCPGPLCLCSDRPISLLSHAANA